jgi:peptidoglycan-associated lipoprotein
MTNRLLIVLALTGLLTACGGSQTKSSGAEVVDGTGAAGEGGATTSGIGGDSASTMGGLDDPSSPLSVRILYFEYDSSDVLPEYREVLEAHANYLAQNPNVSVALEGHADERGTREYNLALGERRSQSVKSQMLVFGPQASQLRTTSYGEERPVSDGHDEQAWSQNRRVEIIY